MLLILFNQSSGGPILEAPKVYFVINFTGQTFRDNWTGREVSANWQGQGFKAEWIS